MADFVVGASLKAYRGGSITNSATLDTSPIPFSGLRSINCGAKGSLKGLYLPINQFEYSFYNDFTIECFLRGDGTTNDGGFLSVEVNLPTGEPEKLYFMIQGDELQLNNYEFPGRGYQTKIGADIGTRTTTDWYHFACVRKDNKYSLFWNGNRVAYDVDSAGNGTADTINIQSDDAYMFKPMGGNNPSNQASIASVLLGTGGNRPSDQAGSQQWGGYIANYRTSYIAQYDPSSSTYTVPSAAFSNFSGTTTYYKDATNNDFYNESDNLPTTFNDLVLENASVGDVTIQTEDNVFIPDGFSLSSSLGNLEPENQVVGISLQTNTFNLINSNVTASTTVPFSGINSYDFTGVTPGANASYTPAFGRECWGFNDFTLECFIRGNGTDDPTGSIIFVPINALAVNPEFGRNVIINLTYSSGNGARLEFQNTFGSSSGNPIAHYRAKVQSANTPLDPSTWYHLAMVRKNNKISLLFDGEVIVQDIDSTGNSTNNLYGVERSTNMGGLGFLFKPFGGLNNTYSLRVREVQLGSGSGSFDNIDGYIANFRSSYIAQYDVTQTTYNPPTGPFIGNESGTAYYAKTFPSSSGNHNAGTAIPQAGINQTVVIQPEGITALNSVTVEVIPTVDVFPSGVSASTSLGDLVPDSEVIGVSLERHVTGGFGAFAGSSPPTRDTGVVPFTGVDGSYDVGDNTNRAYCVYASNIFKRVYSFYNDFTVELFVRGDGTYYAGAFLGIEIQNTDTYEHLSVRHDISGPAEQLVLYNQENGTLNTKDLVSTDIPDAGVSNWKHFALIRKNNKYSMFWDGKRVAHNIDSSGNGTVKGSGSINISSDEAYLFKPIGGNNPNLQNSLKDIFFGVGLPGDGYDALAGYLANTRISYIAQYDPDVSSLDVPTAPFDADASGQEQYNKGQTAGFTNFATTLPTTGGGDFNTTTSLGSVSLNIELDIDATAQSLSLSYNPATGTPSQDLDVTGFSQTLSLGTTTDKQGYDVFGSLLQVQEGNADVHIELPVPVTGQSLITSLGTAAAGPGVFAPTTGQNLTISLGSINLPVTWSNVSTGTTSTWIPVDTGGKSVGP